MPEETRIDVLKAIHIHAVIIEEGSTLLECHTHGLEKFGHMNFSVKAISLFYHSAGTLLNSLADAVINRKETFEVGEDCRWGEWGKFRLEEGKDPGELPVLKIIPYAPRCENHFDQTEGEEA